ncbi:hypothetical protein DXG03_005079 [Asterophora parasitica]|uniref:Protein BCP1 n=1 Tax=Asterophora parasitica TaxID=117018 RepID=A0A9P7FZS6_9AGAR|nr:hypothetical protein DXG03_005079 [Asterophora parasitica]
MSKRKQSEAATRADDGNDSDSGSDVSLIDVDFDFFDPNPSVDYHAIKRLLAQLFQHDADLLHLTELTELVLAQPTVGTTIKTDGIESDPYALLTVLNMHVHHEHPAIKALAQYFLTKSSSSPDFHATLTQLFSQSDAHVGLVLSERLINMPVQVVPPMYNMLVKELQWAIDDAEPYTFTHYLFVSRTYHLSPEEESALMNAAPHSRARPTSKKKRTHAHAASDSTEGERSPDGVYPFHVEDDVIRAAASHTLDYAFTTPSPSTSADEPRPKDAFGLDTRGRVMLVPADGFQALVSRLGEVYSAP